ncbi:histidine kinase [Thalassoporum mexicanum PCC 7367]|uniref:sensor histidine kinase n=1 Tax=Thalassoporum mexicanum TaxID=3457544 RepID=UPI00029FA88E|nr:HAMP domain-containing sensor histidine kinase [Pseudanabaena sp. PCC 7367]AFY71050.1 histidine kinase [Pseudanabaena sp. PCC 7367]
MTNMGKPEPSCQHNLTPWLNTPKKDPGFGDQNSELSDRDESGDDSWIAIDRAKLSHLQFINNLSHEFRTSLSIIYGYLQGVLNREQNLTETQRKALGISLLETERIIDTLQQFLQLKRLQAGRSELSIEPVSVAQLLTETAAIATGKWQNSINSIQILPHQTITGQWGQEINQNTIADVNQVYVESDRQSNSSVNYQLNSQANTPIKGYANIQTNIQTDMQPGSDSKELQNLQNLQNHQARPDLSQESNANVMLQAHPSYLSQALLLLIENAVRYSAPKQPITLRSLQLIEADPPVNANNKSNASNPGYAEHIDHPANLSPAVIIQVCDRGCGIPNREQTKIFEPLYRVERSRSRDTGGIGMGLAMVKALVEAMAGKVFVHSEPEQGSIFSIVLRSA